MKDEKSAMSHRTIAKITAVFWHSPVQGSGAPYSNRNAEVAAIKPLPLYTLIGQQPQQLAKRSTSI
jgi:hypothetical protein